MLKAISLFKKYIIIIISSSIIMQKYIITQKTYHSEKNHIIIKNISLCQETYCIILLIFLALTYVT